MKESPCLFSLFSFIFILNSDPRIASSFFVCVCVCVLLILNRLLLSKTYLTNILLQEPDVIDGADLDIKCMTQSEKEKKIGSNSNKMSVKLLLNKSNNVCLYAEGGEEFAHLLFSFLTFPLGSVTKLFGGHSGI